MDDLRGDAHGGTVANSTGDIVKRLDLLSNETMIHFLCQSGQLCVAASEESEHLIVPPKELTGEFCVTFDPLDGSSNIDAGINVGTIFGIYRRISDSGPCGQGAGNAKDILQPSRNMIAAGYALYGASTMLVLATPGEVNGFILDTAIGEFILTHPKMLIPRRGKTYSINEGNLSLWDNATVRYVAHCKCTKDGHKPYSLRYIGNSVRSPFSLSLWGWCRSWS